MASSFALSEATEQLAELLDRAERGEEIVIQREGRVGTKLVPVQVAQASATGRRIFGQNVLGITYLAPDWNAPMTDDELAEWGM